MKGPTPKKSRLSAPSARGALPAEICSCVTSKNSTRRVRPRADPETGEKALVRWLEGAERAKTVWLAASVVQQALQIQA